MHIWIAGYRIKGCGGTWDVRCCPPSLINFETGERISFSTEKELNEFLDKYAIGLVYTCPHCGEEIPEDTSQCPFCGEEIEK